MSASDTPQATRYVAGRGLVCSEMRNRPGVVAASIVLQ